jgi:hypothetical protein
MHVYIDIETLPAAWSDAEIDAHAAKSVPGNYTKPDSITKWIAENRAELHARTALDGFHARLLAVGVAIEDEDPVVLYTEAGSDTGALGVLEELSRIVPRGDGVTWVGHNILGFDLPMLRRCCWRYGQGSNAAHVLSGRLAVRRSPQVVDTQEVWAGTERGRYYRLDDVARAVGLQGKGGMSGADVYPAWVAGEHERIRSYCAADVALTRAVYWRLF